MYLKTTVFVFLLAILFVQAYVKREVELKSPIQPALKSLKINMEMLQHCLDQSLALAVEDVDTKQVQPVFDIAGDGVNRIYKAFEALTAPIGKTKS